MWQVKYSGGAKHKRLRTDDLQHNPENRNQRPTPELEQYLMSEMYYQIIVSITAWH